MKKIHREKYKKMFKDFNESGSKVSAFKAFLDDGGNYHRGSLRLSFVPDQPMSKTAFILWIVLNVLFFAPHLTAILLAGTKVPFVSFFYFLIIGYIAYYSYKANLIALLFMIYITCTETEVVGSVVKLLGLAEVTLTIYIVSILLLCIVVKLISYPYQSFFHTKRNPDRTFVFTSEKGYQ